ncbi:phosphoribosylglycinamide formyltransferase [Paenibacillus sp. PK4536]|uniref:Phosphoribosylglycinamide formyltransferase n=1 Tax=Paenibacillus nuruki TaxID=1886670 RepID=A0A1E3L0Z0_9BACL|nr:MULTISPECIES: phosphoribosylglycinamide formyltransferase [Paenibacillus]ODP27396.1 Phosphoribosylglycinamide formyltransferase [Paenibacillus nuruki]WIM40950.1 phosphoribosylglycinamide formyltransferase [Paenibacillus sp. PK4536]
MKPFRIAVFASGEGTNFQAMVDAWQKGYFGATEATTIELLVSDKPQAPVVQRAIQAGVDTYVFRPKEYSSREQYEIEIVAELERRGIDLIVLAGYMRLLTPTIVNPYMGRMINVHPSLLPAFPGKDALGQALAYGVKLTGITVHFVDNGMDTGPIVAQQAIEVQPHDTAETLAERIHEIERKLYPQVVAQIAQGKVTLEGRQVIVET